MADFPSARRSGIAATLALLTACSLVYPLGDEFTKGSGGKPVPDGSNAESSTGAESGPSTEGGPNATDPAMLAYASLGGQIHLRRWDESTNAWGPASDGPLLDSSKQVIREVVLRRSPVNGRRILGVLAIDRPPNLTGTLHVYDWNGSAFVEAWTTTSFGSRAEWQPFDITWEGNGPRAIATYENDDDGKPRMRVRDDNGWTGEQLAYQTQVDGGTGFRFAEIVMQSHGNEAFLLSTDPSDHFYAAKWNGNVFSEPRFLATLQNDDHKTFAGAWEEQSGDFLIAAAVNSISFVSIPHGQGVPAALTGPEPKLDITGQIVLASQPGTDRIALAALEQVCDFTNCDDFTTQIWNGNGFDPFAVVDPDITTSYADLEGDDPVAITWSGDKALAFYHRDSQGFRWARWTNGEWRLRDDYAPKTAIGRKANLVPFQVGATTGVMIEDTSGLLWSARYDGENWIDADGDAPLATDLPSPTDFNGVTFAVDRQ